MKFLLVEVKKIINAKVTLVFVSILLLVPVLLVLFGVVLSASEKEFLKDECINLIPQYENNITNLKNEIEKFEENTVTSNRIKKIIFYYQQQKKIHIDMLDALNSSDSKKYLDASLKEAKAMIDGLNSVFLQGVNRDQVTELSNKNEYLQKNEIKSNITFWDVNFANIFTIFYNYLYQVIVPIFVLIISTSFTREYKYNTIKYLCQQPCSRRKIYFFKYLSANLVMLAVFIALNSILFLFSSALGGVGSFQYPVFQMGSADGKILFLTAGVFLAKTIGVLIISTFFFSSIGLLLSLLVKSGIICSLLCAIIAFVPVVFNCKFTNIAIITTSDFYVIYIYILIACTILLFITGAKLFEKKDILL